MTSKESGGMYLVTWETGTILFHDLKIHPSVMKCLSHWADIKLQAKGSQTQIFMEHL